MLFLAVEREFDLAGTGIYNQVLQRTYVLAVQLSGFTCRNILPFPCDLDAPNVAPIWMSALRAISIVKRYHHAGLHRKEHLTPHLERRQNGNGTIWAAEWHRNST